ncbi:hypothetical protein PCE1_002323 [Barthelona sp. PCE]
MNVHGLKEGWDVRFLNGKQRKHQVLHIQSDVQECVYKLVNMEMLKGDNSTVECLRHEITFLKNNADWLNTISPRFLRENHDETGFFMEYCRYGSLFDVLKILKGKNQSFSVKHIRSIMKQMLKHLGALHRRNFVHCDVKLGNILFDSEKRLKLCDFGAVQRIDSEVSRDNFVGTPDYLSPEYHSFLFDESTGSVSINCRRDVYALGVVLHRLVAGKVPNIDFGNHTVRLSPDIPDDLVPSLTEMLSFYEKDRPTAYDLLKKYYTPSLNLKNVPYYRQNVKRGDLIICSDFVSITNTEKDYSIRIDCDGKGYVRLISSNRKIIEFMIGDELSAKLMRELEFLLKSVRLLRRKSSVLKFKDDDELEATLFLSGDVQINSGTRSFLIESISNKCTIMNEEDLSLSQSRLFSSNVFSPKSSFMSNSVETDIRPFIALAKRLRVCYVELEDTGRFISIVASEKPLDDIEVLSNINSPAPSVTSFAPSFSPLTQFSPINIQLSPPVRSKMFTEVEDVVEWEYLGDVGWLSVHGHNKYFMFNGGVCVSYNMRNHILRMEHVNDELKEFENRSFNIHQLNDVPERIQRIFQCMNSFSH